MKPFPITALLICAFALTACVSGEEEIDFADFSLPDPGVDLSGIDVQTETRTSSNPEETEITAPISALLQPATTSTLSSRSEMLIRDRSNNTVGRARRQDVSVKAINSRSNGNVDVELTAFGRTVTFSPDDLNDDGWLYTKQLEDGETTVYLASIDGTWEDLRNGTSIFKYFARISATDFNETTQVNNRLYSVIGETTADMPISGNATFNGHAFGDVYTDNVADSQRTISADAQFDVAFANGGTIEGRFTNILVGDTGRPPDLIIARTAISNGTFRSTFASDVAGYPTECDPIDTARINGQFFGPNAEELGGDFSFRGGTGGAAPFVAAGSFGAKQ